MLPLNQFFIIVVNSDICQQFSLFRFELAKFLRITSCTCSRYSSSRILVQYIFAILRYSVSSYNGIFSLSLHYICKLMKSHTAGGSTSSLVSEEGGPSMSDLVAESKIHHKLLEPLISDEIEEIPPPESYNPAIMYLKTVAICFVAAVDLLSYTIMQPVI
jgi:hypothetical protein